MLSLRAAGPYGTGIVVVVFYAPAAAVGLADELRLGSIEVGWKRLVSVHNLLGKR